MTTAVLVPSSEAVVNAASAKSIAASAPTTTSLGNKNTLDAGRDNGGEEHSTGASANAKLSATSAADAASAHVDEIENANTSNTNMTNKTNNTNTTNNGMAGAVTRAANHLKRCKSTPDGAIACGQKPHKKRRRVSFESADIVEFEPTMFTTTVTSGGIPLGMSLTERSRSRRRLDSWELERQDLRVGRQNYMEEGYLDPAEREQILLNSGGCGEQSMLHVEAEVNQIIAHRRESNEVDFDFLYGLVSIGEEGGNQEDDDEDEDEEEEEEEERDIEEVQLMSQVEGDDDDAVER